VQGKKNLSASRDLEGKIPFYLVLGAGVSIRTKKKKNNGGGDAEKAYIIR